MRKGNGADVLAPESSDLRVILDSAPVRVRMCKHGPMIYYVNDAYIGRSLDLYGEFSEGETDLFRQIIRPGMTVVDVGANVGVHTVVLARIVGPQGRVVAIEPQRPIYHMLCGNVALNQHNNITALHAALGANPGTILVPRIDYTKGSNFGGLALGQWTEGERVNVLTLDSLNLDRCHFVKADVEGMEGSVLEGSEETLRRHKPILYIENDRPQNSAALIRWLLNRSYRLFWHLPRLYNPKNHFGEKNNVFGGTISINMLCTPSTRPVNVRGMREITAPEDTWRGGIQTATSPALIPH